MVLPKLAQVENLGLARVCWRRCSMQRVSGSWLLASRWVSLVYQAVLGRCSGAMARTFMRRCGAGRSWCAPFTVYSLLTGQLFLSSTCRPALVLQGEAGAYLFGGDKPERFPVEGAWA